MDNLLSASVFVLCWEVGGHFWELPRETEKEQRLEHDIEGRPNMHVVSWKEKMDGENRWYKLL